MNMVSLHNHTDFSLLDGAQRCADLVRRCKELGHTAVAQTDHGTMRGFLKFHKACQEHGLKPIFGIEAYVCNDRHQRGLTPEQVQDAVANVPGKKDQREAVKEAEERLGVRQRFHTCLFAKNDEGLRNLFKLSSIGWQEGFYYRPRIDLDAIAKHREGLILSTACVGGVLAHHLQKGHFDEMCATLDKLGAIFGEDLFLEIMPHDFPLQREVNEAMVMLAAQWGAPLVATNDAHYALAEHWKLHEILLAVQTNAVLSDEKRFKFVGGHDYYLKSREEMEGSFANYHPAVSPACVKEALDNTNLLAERCNVTMLSGPRQSLLPQVEIAPYHVEEFLSWALEAYPEQYQAEPCPLDAEAPSAAVEGDVDVGVAALETVRRARGDDPYTSIEAAIKASKASAEAVEAVAKAMLDGAARIDEEIWQACRDAGYETSFDTIRHGRLALSEAGYLGETGATRETSSGSRSREWKWSGE